MKGALRLRPVFHHREERIRSYVQLRWLGLLLIRVVENGASDTWRNIRPKLDRMHLVALETAERRIAQRSATTPGQVKILKVFELADPVRFLDFELPASLAWSRVARSCDNTILQLRRARSTSSAATSARSCASHLSKSGWKGSVLLWRSSPMLWGDPPGASGTA